MAYSKTLISDVRPQGYANYDAEVLQGVVTTINTNLSAIESEFSTVSTEGTADIVGAMLTGNTETGITVTYQDSDNTIDFVVAYGATEPAAVSSATSGAVGEANSAARSDHQIFPKDTPAFTHGEELGLLYAVINVLLRPKSTSCLKLIDL